MRTDDELLGLLGQALRPSVAPEPSLRELMALEEAVRCPPAAPARRFRATRHTIAAILGAGVLATSGTAFAFEQGHVPDPVRSVAHAIGLPVQSPDEHDARVAARHLRDALRHDDEARLRVAASTLEERLRDLPAADRRAVAEPLLAVARARLDHGNGRAAAAHERHDGPPIEDGVNQGTIPARDDRGDTPTAGQDARGDNQGPADGTRSGGKGATTASTSRRPGEGGSGRDGGGSGDRAPTATTTTVTVRSGAADHGGNSGPGLGLGDRRQGFPDVWPLKPGRN